MGKSRKKAKKNQKSDAKKAGKKSDMKKTKYSVRKKKVRAKYPKEAVERALKAVAAGVPYRKAAETFGVPPTTIHRKCKNPALLECKIGPPTILSMDEEREIVQWLIKKSQTGNPATKTELLDSVQFYMKSLKKETPFINDRPGRHWYEGFFKRHPEVKIRTAQHLALDRASVTEENLRNWFAEVGNYLKTKSLLDVEPASIFNCDETNIQLCPKPEKVIAQKGARTVYKVVDANEKESVTALFMYSASGVRAPPMVLYTYKENVPKKIIDSFPSGWGIGLSESGWMTTETFYEYFTNVFYKWLVAENIKFPVIVYMDGHSSHCSIPLVKFCRERNIELISLYPHATHILQPLDVGLFHPFKEIWKRVVPQWKIENNVMRLRKEQFPSVLKIALEALTNESEIVKAAFKACGLVPFNPDAVEYNVLNKSKKKKDPCEENHQSQEHIESQESQIHQQESADQFLKLFEKTLDSEILEEFHNAEARGQWTGSIEKKGLFDYWLSIKHKNHGI